MKKQILFAAATMFALAFTSCKKYEVSEPLELSSLPTVTIKGNMYAELDETNQAVDNAPAGLQVTVSIPFTDYNTNASTGNHIVSTTTDANGNFSIRVPVMTSGVNATISFESFTAVVLKDIGANTNLEVTSHFKLADVTVNGLGSGNSTQTIDLGSLEYTVSTTDPTSGSFTPATTKMFSGKLEFERKLMSGPNPGDPNVTVYAPIPDGTILHITIVSKDEFGTKEFHQTKTVTTTSGGKYEIEVPIVKNGSANLNIKVDEILPFEDALVQKNFLYKYSTTFAETIYFVDYTNKDYQINKTIQIQELN